MAYRDSGYGQPSVREQAAVVDQQILDAASRAIERARARRAALEASIDAELAASGSDLANAPGAAALGRETVTVPLGGAETGAAAGVGAPATSAQPQPLDPFAQADAWLDEPEPDPAPATVAAAAAAQVVPSADVSVNAAAAAAAAAQVVPTVQGSNDPAYTSANISSGYHVPVVRPANAVIPQVEAPAASADMAGVEAVAAAEAAAAAATAAAAPVAAAPAAPAPAPADHADDFHFYDMPTADQVLPQPHQPAHADAQTTAPVNLRADSTAPVAVQQAALRAGDVARSASSNDTQTKPLGYELPIITPVQMAAVQAAQEVDQAAAPAPAPNPAQAAARYLDAFFSELARCGVVDYVVSPGSRSTAIACKAFERFSNVYVHVDDRGAAFFALGLAKAKRRPVAVIGPGGTAVGNWMPAVLEAEAARVPLLLLSADAAPQQLQVGEPATCDQRLFGAHVKRFAQMPQPSDAPDAIAFVRQAALEACIAAHGSAPGRASCDAGPVHLNFPFNAVQVPLPKQEPDRVNPLPPTVVPGQGILPADARGIFGVFHGKRTVAVCGEGTCNSSDDAQVLLDFARRNRIPLLASPESGLRSVDDPLIIDCYNTICAGDAPRVDALVRFGRWPESDRVLQALCANDPQQIVVDMRDTRDRTCSTALFVRALPVVFAAALRDPALAGSAHADGCVEWVVANDRAREQVQAAPAPGQPNLDTFEGAYVGKLLDMLPAASMLYCGCGVSSRAVDTLLMRSQRRLTVLRNAGMGGVDGLLASALGASQEFEQSTVVCGDLTFLHDCNALALQNEMRVRETRGDGIRPSVIVVVLNNNGGGLYDAMPQKSRQDYFGRLFQTPQNVELRFLAQAFGVPYRRASTVEDFRRAYNLFLGQAGINVIDVPLPLEGLSARWSGLW